MPTIYLPATNYAEFVSMFLRSASILSTDDMAKIQVGPTALSWYHQVCKMFMKDDKMNLSDHNFPIPGYLLNTSGYMWLQNNPQNQTHVNKLQSSSSFNITDDYDKQPHQWISNIMISSRALSLLEVLELQLKSHRYIYSTSDQISEHIFEKIKNFSDIYRTCCKGSQEEFNEFITTPNNAWFTMKLQPSLFLELY